MNHPYEEDALRRSRQIAKPFDSYKGEHEHQYTIPVEWVKGSTSGKYRVTKLRCICGDEVNR